MRKNLFLLISRIAGIILLSMLILVFLFWGGLNIFKHLYYREYFSSMTKVGKISGLCDGFVPQGLTFYDGNKAAECNDSDLYPGLFVSAGYMTDGSVSRIYVSDETGVNRYFTLASGGNTFFGHTGGLQYENGVFYLANEGTGLYKFDDDFLKNNVQRDDGSYGVIEIGMPVDLINHSSFVFTQPGYIYVGEFNNDKNYVCSNKISYNGQEHRAIVTKYNIDDLFVSGDKVPIAVYSIPNEIQGFCITEEGNIVLSRSYSVSSSNFFIYGPDNIVDTGNYYAGAPVYFLGEPERNILGPAMSEDLDLYKGEVITHFESACNKYFFGKLFFANYIACLKL